MNESTRVRSTEEDGERPTKDEEDMVNGYIGDLRLLYVQNAAEILRVAVKLRIPERTLVFLLDDLDKMVDAAINSGYPFMIDYESRFAYISVRFIESPVVASS